MRSLDAGTLRAYLARNYCAPDMLVAAAGAVDHAEWSPRSSSVSQASAAPRAPAPEPARFGGGTHVERANSSRCISRWRCRRAGDATRQLYNLQVFTSVLGGGMSSRLFQEVREKRGLCYSIYAFHMPYSDIGMFGLYAGTDEADTPELMRVASTRSRSAPRHLTEPEVARAKAQMKAGLLMALESSGARIGQMARQMLTYGRPSRSTKSCQGRRGDGRERARRRPRAHRPRQAGDRRDRTWLGT